MEKKRHPLQLRQIIGLLLAAAVAILAVMERDLLFLKSGRPDPEKIALCLAAWLLGIVITLCSLHLSSDRASRMVSILYAVLSPVFIFLAGECMTSGGTGTGSLYVRAFGEAAAKPDKFAINVLLISLIVILFTFLAADLRIGPWAACFLCLFFCAANIYVKMFRGNAITAADITTLSTAADVASGYTLTMRIDIFEGTLLFYLFLVVGLRLRKCSLARGWRRVLLALVGVAVFSAGLRTFVFSDWLKDNGIRISYFDTMKSYRHHGTAAVFARSLNAMFPRQPEGYSPDAALAIARQYNSDSVLSHDLPEADLESDGVSLPVSSGRKGSGSNAFSSDEAYSVEAALPEARSPNVIVIINESFADLEKIGPFETSEDPMPFLHSLEKTFPSGVTYASVYGGMTANTEFEFLTNCSMSMVNASTVPFQIYLRSAHPSMASWMKTLGYCGICAFHPHKAHNYRRNQTYPLLGFETFYHRENVPIPMSTIRGFASDEADYDNLIAIYEQTRKTSSAPFFFYNMTVQNHSPFDTAESEYPSRVHAEGLKRTYPDVDQYLTLIRESDQAFEKLVEYFSGISEPTVILFMGDHQPALSNGFLNEISGTTAASRTAEENMMLYQVPYVIWSNFECSNEIPEKTSMNYMQTNLIQSYGGALCGYQRFLADLMTQIPVINAHGYWGSNGVFYETDDKSSPYYERYHEYEILSYNYLFDNKGRLEGFFG